MRKISKKKHHEQTRLLDAVKPIYQKEIVELNKAKFISILSAADELEDVAQLRDNIQTLIDIFFQSREDEAGILSVDPDEESIPFQRDVLISELEQIIEAQTISRSKYYIERLIKGTQVRKTKINDINLARWKEYEDILTDTLWNFPKRENHGAHLASYWGNFVPQIPYQIMTRFTKEGDWVLDTFLGSGTTLIECRRLARNGIGIEINPEVARGAEELIEKQENVSNVTTDVIAGDSGHIDYEALLKKHNITNVQLIIMHPLYHDIIKFSKDENDLSNAKSVEEFLQMFGKIVEKATACLEVGRYLALIIGDKYSNGEWVPLGFYCMNKVMEQRNFLLKSLIVKNFEGTRGKRNQTELWRYRALVGGFYVFKHEYVILFQKL